MKCLIFNTKEISFTKGESSGRPPGITPIPSDADYQTYYNIVVAFVCAEANDNNDDISTIANELLRYHNMVGKKILVVPFVHLSCNVAVQGGYQYIKQLSKILEEKCILEGILGFGYHRSLIAKWISLNHKGSVAFRDSKYKKYQNLNKEKENG